MAVEGTDAHIRVWADGCYDMVHFGHANQLRQAKAFGHHLMVGVHTDEEIAKHKGPPVFNEAERYRMVRAIKWVDEVIEGAPYETTVATLDHYDCQFCVHGDDITLTAEGTDTYAAVKAAGRYRECSRTAGVSTTDLVGRMLLATKTHHSDSVDASHHPGTPKTEQMSTDGHSQSPWTRVSAFMPSTRQIREFSEGRNPRPTDRVVYCSGAFDLFHIGHLAFLEEAAKLGDYLIVGLHDDRTVNRCKGGNHPIQTMHERLLSCLAYKPVSEVIMNAPYTLTDDLIERFKVRRAYRMLTLQITTVCHGVEEAIEPDPETGDDRYAAAKTLGMFKTVSSGNDMTTAKIVERIIQHKLAYEQRNKAKQAKEVAAFEALQRIKKETGASNEKGAMQSVKIDVAAALAKSAQ